MLGVLKVVFYLAFIHCAHVSSRVIAVLYVLHHNYPAWTVGVIISLYSFLPSLLAIHVGKWIDRIGIRIPVLSGVVLVAVACLLPVFLPIDKFGIYPLLGTATLAGVGFLFTQISGQGLIGYLTNIKNRATGFTYQSMAFSVSSSVGPVVAGYMIDNGSYNLAFMMACGMVCIGTIIYLLEAHGLPNFCSTKKITTAGSDSSTLYLLKLPNLRNVLIASALVSMAWDLQSFMIPVYGTEIGLDAVAVGWLLSTFSVCTFAVRVVMPFLSRAFRQWPIILTVIAVSGLTFVVLPCATSLPILFIFVGLLGLFLGASQPNVMALLHQSAPQGRAAEAIGIRTMFTNMSHTVFPLLFGIGGSVVGAAVAFWVLGATMLGSDAFLLRSVKKLNLLNTDDF